MSYLSLIDKSLILAFNSAKDLAVTITLTKKVGKTFDFGNAEVEDGTTSIVTTKAIWLDAEKLSKENVVIKRKIMFKRIGDVNQFDTITDNGVIWKIDSPLKDDGFISVLEVSRNG